MLVQSHISQVTFVIMNPVLDSQRYRPSAMTETGQRNDFNTRQQQQRTQLDYQAQLQFQLQQQNQLLQLNRQLLEAQQLEAEAAFRAMSLSQAIQSEQSASAYRPHQPVQRSRSMLPEARSYSMSTKNSSIRPPSPLPLAPQGHPAALALQPQPDLTPEDELNAATNPLVASALARRKRQSLNAEAVAALSSPPHSNQNRRSMIPPSPSATSSSTWERHARSPSLTSSSTASSSLKTPPMPSEPPSVILSRPGEAYPCTSGSDSGGSASEASSPTFAEMRTESKATTPRSTPRFFVPTHTYDSVDRQRASSNGSSTDSIEIILDRGDSPPIFKQQEEKKSRRRSHLGTLELALGARQQRQTPPPPVTAQFESFPRPEQESSYNLSPFASTFVPVPPTPSTAFISAPSSPYMTPPSTSFYQSNRPAPIPGTATPIRQPRGPPSDLNGNFASRVRRGAIKTLLQGRGAMNATAKGSADVVIE